MFTGIVSAIGRIVSVEVAVGPGSADARERAFVIETPFDDVVLGESIAVNGACLTAAKLDAQGRLTFFASVETCERTNLGVLSKGDTVNLERAMRLSDRVSGHLVQGHVDGRARLAAIRPVGESHELEIELPQPLMKYVIEKGSITLDGISLTVNTLKNSAISLMIIPHTWQHTTLAGRRVGDVFNVELDMIAKYVERLMAPQ